MISSSAIPAPRSLRASFPLLCVVLLVLAANLTFGQSPRTSSPSAPMIKVPQQITVFFFGTGESAEELSIDTASGEKRTSPLYDGGTIGPVVREKSPTLELKKIQTDPTALDRWRENNPGALPPMSTLPKVHKTAATVALPDSPNILVVVNFNGGNILGTMALDQSEKALPRGRIAVTNLCASPIAIQLGEHRTVLPRRKAEAIPFSTPTGRPASVRLTLGQELNGEWKLIDDSSVVLNPLRRRHAFLVPQGPTGVSLYMLPAAPADPKAGLQ